MKLLARPEPSGVWWNGMHPPGVMPLPRSQASSARWRPSRSPRTGLPGWRLRWSGGDPACGEQPKQRDEHEPRQRRPDRRARPSTRTLITGQLCAGRLRSGTASDDAQQPVALLVGDVPHPDPLGHPASSRRPRCRRESPIQQAPSGRPAISTKRGQRCRGGTSLRLRGWPRSSGRREPWRRRRGPGRRWRPPQPTTQPRQRFPRDAPWAAAPASGR